MKYQAALLVLAVLVAGGCGSKPANDAQGAKSPEGTLLYSSFGEESADLFVVRADGSGQRNLTRSKTDEYSPDWSPDGKSIVFGRQVDGPNGPQEDLFVMRADGSSERRLTETLERDEKEPAWSPDGKSIVFVGSNPIPGGESVFVMPAEGGAPTRLTYEHDFPESPSWSPDGAKIAFNSAVKDDDNQIFVMNADGSGQVAITPGPIDLAPAWSPRGDLIAFQRNGEPNTAVFLVRPEGGKTTRLGPVSVFYDSMPSWSPDGALISTIGLHARDDVKSQGLYLHDPAGDRPLIRVASVGLAESAAVWRPTKN